MIEIFKLIRLRNIAFTAFTMYAIRYFLVLPLVEREGIQLQLSEGNFSLLVIAVCCLVSAAYVINDYFDTKADRISKTRPVVVGCTFSRRGAIALHTLLNVVAVGIGLTLAYRVHHWEIGLMFIAASVILWFYSSRFKKHFLWGNLIVAFMAGLIPLSGIVLECANVASLFYTTLLFSYFLFLNILMYEINKDMYSINGDRDDKIITLPVKLGIPKTRVILVGLVAGSIVSLVIVAGINFMNSPVMLLYMAVALILPYLIYGWAVRKGDNMKFQLRMIRLIMVLCMCLCFPLHYFLTCQS